MTHRKRIKNLTVWAVMTAFLGLAGPLSVVAQDDVPRGNLMGFVYEEDGKTPLEDARVILRKVKGERGDKEYRSEETPETGDYRIDNVPAGRYRALILTETDKLYPTLSAVNVVADQTVVRSFHLAPRRPFGAFFIEPCGIAMIIAGTALTVKIIKKGGEEEVSPTER